MDVRVISGARIAISYSRVHYLGNKRLYAARDPVVLEFDHVRDKCDDVSNLLDLAWACSAKSRSATDYASRVLNQNAIWFLDEKQVQQSFQDQLGEITFKQ